MRLFSSMSKFLDICLIDWTIEFSGFGEMSAGDFLSYSDRKGRNSHQNF